MRKRKRIALIVALSLVIGIQAPYEVKNEKNVVKAEEQQTENDTVESQDKKSVYRELEDGTISLLYYNGEIDMQKGEDGNERGILTIPDTVDGKTVTELEGTLFDNFTEQEKVSEINFPKEVKKIDVTFMRNVFYLMALEVDKDNAYFTTKDGILYNKDCTVLLRVPQAAAIEKDSKNFVIPDTVERIENDAFFNCYGMTHITISKNVKSIGELVFYRYLSLDSYFSFEVDKENQYFVADENGSLFSKDKTILYRYAYHVSEDEMAFVNFTTYTIPESVTEIASTAFQGSTEFSAFGGLLYVEFPKNLKKIGSNAFDNCTYLGDQSMLAFAGGLTSVDIVIPDSVEEIGAEAFLCCPFETIVLPKSLKEIQSATFFKCSGLTSIRIPENVGSISDIAFMGCTSLKEVTLNDKLKSIGDRAFFNCSALEKMEIGENVETIGNNAIGFDWGDTDVEPIENFSILCKEGSAADRYAKENGISTKYSAKPTVTPVSTPSNEPSATPSNTPENKPSATPSNTPSNEPSATPVSTPSNEPSATPVSTPSNEPSATPASTPTNTPGVEADETPAPVVVKVGKASIKSAVNKKAKKIVIKINKAKNATGYVVQYATSKKFKNAKNKTITKKSVNKITLKKLKKKTYYVRVRAFIKSDKGTEYSSWSKAKKVKVKK